MTDHTELLERLDIFTNNTCHYRVAQIACKDAATAIRELDEDIKQITETNIGLQTMYYDRGETIDLLREQIQEWESGALVLGWREMRAATIKSGGEKKDD